MKDLNLVVKFTYRVAFFSGPPPNLTKSQAHYKFLDLGNLGGGQFNLYRAWDLVKLGGGQKKRPPCISKMSSTGKSRANKLAIGRPTIS